MNPKVIDIKVYGTETSGQQMVVKQLHSFLSRAELNYDIEQVTDVTRFIDEGIESVPAIQYQDNPVTTLTRNGAFNQSLRNIISSILKTQNFGELPQIIVPTDFSDTSINALYYGQRLATELGAVIKLLHSYEPSPQNPGDSKLIQPDFKSLRESHLQLLAKQIDVDWGSEILNAPLVGTEFHVGRPADEIIKSAKKNRAQLVVMGTTGDSKRIKKWFGSTTTKVINESPVPVLLVPRNAPFKEIKKILFVYENDHISQNSVSDLMTFGSVFSSKIQFLHIQTDKVTANNDPYIKMDVESTYGNTSHENVNLEPKDICAFLNKYVHSQEVDMIVFNARQQIIFQNLFDQSVQKEMSIHSDFPVLILKSE